MIKTSLKTLGDNPRDPKKKVIKIYHWIAVMFIVTVIHICSFSDMISLKTRKVQLTTICWLNTLKWMKDKLTTLFFLNNLEMTVRLYMMTNKLFLMINTLLLSNILKIMNKKVLVFSKWTTWKSPCTMRWRKMKSIAQIQKKSYFWTISRMKKWESREFFL